MTGKVTYLEKDGLYISSDRASVPDTVKHPTELGAADFDSPVTYAVVPAGVRFTGNNIDGTKHFNVTGPGTIDLIAQGVIPLRACYRVRLDYIYKAPNVRNASAIFNPETSTIDVTWTLPDLSSVNRQRIQTYSIYPQSSNKAIGEIPYMQVGQYNAEGNHANSIGSGGKVLASEVTRVIIKLLDNLYFPYISIQTNYGGMSSPNLYIPVIAPPSYNVPEFGLKPDTKLDYIPDDSVLVGRKISLYRLPVSNSITGGRIYIGDCKDLTVLFLYSDGRLLRSNITGNPISYQMTGYDFQVDIPAGITTVFFNGQGSGSRASPPINIEPYPFYGNIASHSIIIP
jgi:hypothetical protein